MKISRNAIIKLFILLSASLFFTSCSLNSNNEYINEYEPVQSGRAVSKITHRKPMKDKEHSVYKKYKKGETQNENKRLYDYFPHNSNEPGTTDEPSPK